jgi:hypothetical protein
MEGKPLGPAVHCWLYKQGPAKSALKDSCLPELPKSDSWHLFSSLVSLVSNGIQKDALSHWQAKAVTSCIKIM